MANNKGKFCLGAVLGAGLTYLFTTKKGEDVRKTIKSKSDDLIKKVKKIDVKEVADDISAKIEEIKEELASLDKEKALDIAKTQGKKLQKKAEELYNYAIEKGTPVLQDATDELRKQAIKVTKEITKKLEAANKTTTKK